MSFLPNDPGLPILPGTFMVPVVGDGNTDDTGVVANGPYPVVVYVIVPSGGTLTSVGVGPGQPNIPGISSVVGPATVGPIMVGPGQGVKPTYTGTAPTWS